MKFILLYLIAIVNSLNVTNVTNTTCIYNNITYTENQSSWIIEEDAECYCINSTWTYCD
jgi:hypothetical protein